MFKARIQPLCRACGGPIPKVTRSVYIESKPLSEYHIKSNKEALTNSFSSRYIHATDVKTKEQCQKLTNCVVMAVRFNKENAWSLSKEPYVRQVYYFTEWDGETYKDEYFCKDPCAVKLAYAAVANGTVLKAYNTAMENRKIERKMR